jgi:hypothetical protein
MHAVVVTASIAAGQNEAARQVLREQVVSRVRQSPGLVKAYWSVSADGTKGVSMAVFDSKEHAEAAANIARTNPPPPGVTLNTVDINEVVAET